MREDDERRRTHTAAIDAGKQTIAERDGDSSERVEKRARELMRRLRREYRGRVRQG